MVAPMSPSKKIASGMKQDLCPPGPMEDGKEVGGRGGERAFMRLWNRILFLCTLATLIVFIAALIVVSTAPSPDSLPQQIVFASLAGFSVIVALAFNAYFGLVVWKSHLFSRGYRIALFVDVVLGTIIALAQGGMSFWVLSGSPRADVTTFYLATDTIAQSPWLAAFDFFANCVSIYMHAGDGLFEPYLFPATFLCFV